MRIVGADQDGLAGRQHDHLWIAEGVGRNADRPQGAAGFVWQDGVDRRQPLSLVITRSPGPSCDSACQPKAVCTGVEA